ncbi:DUF4430 domain-containing protein [Bacillus marinisedimentorum]|uniref:DUF4430 domain-containing protein n=1 Tax=Bacillus marinisedimentorum TaxID=1821260 RepID=UPI0008729BFC|nr:DUF4430 domain-containing protein [Bacillus marinisedimentorum]
MKKWSHYLMTLMAAFGLIFMTGCTQAEEAPADEPKEETTADEAQEESSADKPKEEEKAATETEESAATESGEAETEQVVIQVVSDEGEAVAEKDIEANGDSLLDIMKENFEVEEKDGFIQSIEGEAQSEEDNKFWVYEVDGEQVTVGAQEFTPEGGEEIVWKLTQF